MNADAIKKALQKVSDPERAQNSAWFFKTGKGEYEEGDIFIGITVPQQREVAQKFLQTDLKDIQKLLHSPIHEHRLTALIILTQKYKKSRGEEYKIFDFYLKNTKYINHWDLVDTSAAGIVGKYLIDKDRGVLYSLARSKNIWERRIAIIASHAFLISNDFKDILQLAEILLADTHDLIQKAVGWTLREVGKKDQEVEEKFLKKYYKTMPRTALRYAIERFTPQKKNFYMNKSEKVTQTK